MLHFDNENAAIQKGWTIIGRSNDKPVLYQGNQYQMAKASSKLTKSNLFLKSFLFGFLCFISLGIALANRRIRLLQREISYKTTTTTIYLKTFNQFPVTKKISLADGSIYEGQTKEGLPEGVGTCIYTNDSFYDRYEGEWKNGKPNGKGKVTLKDRETIEANYVDGEPEGEIKCTTANHEVSTWTIKKKSRYILQGTRKSRPPIPAEWQTNNQE